MTWIAPGQQGQREQLGRFLLGTGGLGGIAVQTGPGIGLTEEEGLAFIDRAAGEGITTLDTADVYAGGASEQIVGTWLDAHPATAALIQTKTGVTADGPDLSPERIERQLAHSIKVLGRVDLYLAHTVDPRTPWADSLPVFSRAVEAGTIRAYGLSNVDERALTSALETADRLGLVRPEIVQNRYSLLARQDDQRLLPLVQAERLAYTPYSPLANGVLAGRYSHGEQPAHGSRASIASWSAGYLSDAATMDNVRKFDRLAAGLGVTPAGLAQAWLINHPIVTAPIVGPSKESHWTGLHEAVQLAWAPQIGEQLDALFS
jgi:aryl-alcohol dehydrogenase-like predicted oxidoreductase